jgi:hypothetical protein
MEEMPEVVAALRDLYANDATMKPFFDVLARYRNQMRSIKVDVIQTRLGSPRRGITVKAFKTLRDLGLGLYIKGAHGHPSRFEFAKGTGPSRIGLLAQGVDDEDDLPDDDDELDPEVLESVFDEDDGISVELKDFSTEDIILELKRRGASTVTVAY